MAILSVTENGTFVFNHLNRHIQSSRPDRSNISNKQIFVTGTREVIKVNVESLTMIIYRHETQIVHC